MRYDAAVKYWMIRDLTCKENSSPDNSAADALVLSALAVSD
jgi:hypothetical protein